MFICLPSLKTTFVLIEYNKLRQARFFQDICKMQFKTNHSQTNATTNLFSQRDCNYRSYSDCTY